MNAPLLKVVDLRVDYGAHTAIEEISFELSAGETLGLVGESGSGKSTLARAVLRLIPASRGRVEWLGADLLTCRSAAMRARRRDLQIVFQDPLASLNPRMTVGDAIAEPLILFERGVGRKERATRVARMLERVGLGPEMASRYPHEFSGGQCQRIGIARAMVLNPKLLVCDEAVSSLDVSIQGQIVNLLLDLQRETGMAMLFISHNLAVVRQVSHRVLVMYRGKFVEVAPQDAFFSAALHPYSRALLAAVPRIGTPAQHLGDTERNTAEPPQAGASDYSSGCAYRDRCAYAISLCALEEPRLTSLKPAHWAACHRASEFLFKAPVS
jgi:oligopeptide transport system ATP-binding protein